MRGPIEQENNIITEPTDDTFEYDGVESLSEDLEPDARPVCLDCFTMPIMFVLGIGFLLFSENAKPYISVKLKNTLLITAILITVLELFLFL